MRWISPYTTSIATSPLRTIVQCSSELPLTSLMPPKCLQSLLPNSYHPQTLHSPGELLKSHFYRASQAVDVPHMQKRAPQNHRLLRNLSMLLPSNYLPTIPFWFLSRKNGYFHRVSQHIGRKIGGSFQLVLFITG